MAFEIISEIVEAEQRAEQLKADAVKKAEELEKEAVEKAKNIALDSSEKAAADRDKLIQEAIDSSKDPVSEIIRAAEAEAEKIGEKVQTLKPSAVKAVMRKVVGDNVDG